MGRFMAAVYDRMLAPTEAAGLADWRRELLGELEGDILEVGSGTGLNLRHYDPARVAHLTLTEPDPHMRAHLESAATTLGIAHDVRDCAAESLPFADASFDVAVCTLVLCSVDSPSRTLAELRRVLRPGGRLVFLEHVASDDPNLYRWQRRLEPIWRRLAGNCHVTRHSGVAIVDSGFVLDQLVPARMPKALGLVRPTVRGWATKPREG